MADEIETIRDVCSKLLEKKNLVKDDIKELLKLTAKGQFYASNTYNILIKQLSEHHNKKDSTIVTKIFCLLNHVYSSAEPKLIKPFMITFYNFAIKACKEDSSDVFIEEVLNLSKLTKSPTSETYIVYFNLTRFFTLVRKIYSQKKFRDIINVNFRFLIEAAKSDLSLQKDLFDLFWKTIERYFNIDRNYTISADFLLNGICEGLKLSGMEMKEEEIVLEYFDLILKSVHYGDSEMIKACCKIIVIGGNILTEKEHKSLNSLLHVCLKTFSSPKITESSFNEFYQSYFKDIKSSKKSTVQHKIFQIVARQFINHRNNLELTDKLFSMCHEFVYKLLNLVKYIKNEECYGMKCCTDIKRHLALSLSICMIDYANRLIDCGIFDRKDEKLVQFHIDYSLVLYKSLSCSSKSSKHDKLSKSLQKIFYSLLDKVSLLSSNINVLAQTYKMLVKLEEMKESDANLSNLVHIGSQFVNIEYEKSDENIKIFADAILYPIIFSLKIKNFNQRLVTKMIYSLHEALKSLKYSSVVDYVKKKLENSEFANYSADIDMDELLVLELEGVHRYDMKNYQELSLLFQKISKNDNNIKLLARACSSINDEAIKVIDMKKFKDLNERLERNAAVDKDIQVYIALTVNNYYMQFIETEKLENLINSTKKDVLEEIPDCLNLDNELKIVDHLDKSLEFATEVLMCIKENPELLSKISSFRLFTMMLENISTQYFVRGIANKDLEAKLILWNLLQFGDNPEMLIDTASFFIDNYNRLIGNSGHYICISKKLNYVRIEELIPKANEALENLLENIETKSEAKQVRPLNYMISLWSYYMIYGRRVEGRKIWERYESIRKVCKLENPLYVGTVDAKKLVSLAEINIKCFKRNAVDHLYNAIILLQKIKTIYADYSNNFQFIYRTLILKVINYSLNRMVDVEHFSNAMLTIKNQAIRKGLFVKTLELFSLSVLRHLNMEKLDDAKADLKNMSKMLKLEDNILIETPISSKQQQIRIFDFENPDTLVRKAIPKLSSRKSTIEIFNDSSDGRNELLEQLQNFVHKHTCKCSICKYPQLKFILFQMGCHYSRLLYLMDKFDISRDFNEYALEPWRFSSLKILRTKDIIPFCISKQDFVSFSIRWLFQAADSFIRNKDYSNVEEIHTEIELICTNNIEDYECIKQLLHARMQNLEFLMKHENKFEKEGLLKELSYEEFIKSKIKSPQPVSSATLMKKSSNKSAESKKHHTLKPASAPSKLQSHSNKPKLVESVIYVDSDDNDNEKPKETPRKPVKSTKSTKAKVTAEISSETPRARLRRC